MGLPTASPAERWAWQPYCPGWNLPRPRLSRCTLTSMTSTFLAILCRQLDRGIPCRARPGCRRLYRVGNGNASCGFPPYGLLRRWLCAPIRASTRPGSQPQNHLMAMGPIPFGPGLLLLVLRKCRNRAWADQIVGYSRLPFRSSSPPYGAGAGKETSADISAVLPSA